MEVADVKYMEQQLKAQFEVQKEILEQKYDILSKQYNKLLERYQELLSKTKQLEMYNVEEFEIEE